MIVLASLLLSGLAGLAALWAHLPTWCAAGAALATASVSAAVVFGVDKSLARRTKPRQVVRVSERTLIVLSCLGGAPGAWLAMQALRHKTQTLKFRVVVPMLAVLQLAALAALALRGQ